MFGKPIASQWLELGHALKSLADDQAEWSQKTFGPDDVKGPLGALRHLEKETVEAQAEAVKVANLEPRWSFDKLQTELADCLILLLDANRRAGFTPLSLVKAAQAKMTVNKARQWPAYDPGRGDVPVEHVREGAGLPHPGDDREEG